ncbi:serine hydrolase [Sediminibacterium soli]|uniref:serine hydrolase n=1 Tax=Sediminibacterium soli TaxID=2698829 RepID=UPI0013798BFD|nr:serine hydrolase [Sediminibacterium soli]NCI45956.1 serine hydrolase [Sediminibacterium soli]
MKNILSLLVTCCCIAVSLPAEAQEKNSEWLKQLLYSKASPLLKKVLDHPDSFQYQIIYTQISRDSRNRPSFEQYYLHTDRDRYYNPASTVKLPVALAALEKIHALKRYGVDKYTPMLTDSGWHHQTVVHADSSAGNGLPSVAQYVKKIFLVSDNDAYNRLYEFNGQQSLNETLQKKGYLDTRIVRRFVGMTEEENRHTNPIRFVKDTQTLYTIPPAYSTLAFDYSKQVLVGQAHWDKNDSLIHAPMDFTRHNNFPLEDLQYMLQSVVFPGSVPARRRFRLGAEDRQFLLQYMSELPSESRFPNYDTTEFFDSYTKFFLYKAGKQKPPPYIRIFNKPGWSYGYLTDAAYIVDFLHNTEFMISANIYVNRDGVLNDNKYEYNETGYPFFREIGEIIYQYELTRPRKYKPVLDEFRLSYR